MPDAVVVGAGPNGLVGANLLADAGWDVEVLEAEPEPGGRCAAARSRGRGSSTTASPPSTRSASASPHMVAMDLEAHGVRWRRHPIAVAHPAADGSAAYIAADLDETCASVDAFAPGDGRRWRDFHGLWARVGER